MKIRRNRDAIENDFEEVFKTKSLFENKWNSYENNIHTNTMSTIRNRA